MKNDPISQNFHNYLVIIKSCSNYHKITVLTTLLPKNIIITLYLPKSILISGNVSTQGPVFPNVDNYFDRNTSLLSPPPPKK